ncbi:MAG: bifunctional glutamate N-acetyltransferase/amino-acid acetyltransferase ArgJ [Verrucomicrobiota bacterium]
MNPAFRTIRDGGVTSAQGFLAAGVSCGIKANKHAKDMAMLVSTVPAQVAATFTTNPIKAAPVKLSMKHTRNGMVRGVVVNSGNANACTGVVGIQNACEMGTLAATEIDCKPNEMLVCSTGRIGVPLPMPRVRKGIRKAARQLMAQNGSEAAKAIMTTDTTRKEVSIRMKIDGCAVTIGGMAKGAGMIHPNMATMLCFITTDAKIAKRSLCSCVSDAVEQSFNRISVDGDTSTNDSVMVFANGLAGNNELKSYHPQYELFQQGLVTVMRKLARMIVQDGEGTSRVIDVTVQGAARHADAKAVALAVARSSLCKCAFYGADPNWGRLMSAIGQSGAKVREELVEIHYDGLSAVANGTASKTPPARLRKVVRKSKYTITINLHLGKSSYTMLTSDLTEEYVRFNADE